VAEIQHALDAATAGDGRAVLIEGPPGAGKSRLLHVARQHASEAGFRVLVARGEEYERDFSFGVARQLFEPFLRRTTGEPELLAGPLAAPAHLALGISGPSEPLPDPGAAARLGLYTLATSLEKKAPLLVAVDDAQWADLASLRWLAYLVRRLSGHRTAVVATVGARATPDDLETTLDTAAVEQHVVTVHPGTLGPAAVGELVKAVFARPGEEQFVQAVHHATGGNPFLVHELLVTLQVEGLEPVEKAASEIGGRVPERVAKSTLARIGRLGPDALAVARAVAVLGEASVREVALLSGLEHEAAGAAADSLGAAGLFELGRPVRFSHPIIRSAVYGSLTPGARDAAHARAARISSEGGQPPERAAGHLLAVEPRGDERSMAILHRAAEIASSRGAPQAAVRFLRRAIAEPPPRSARCAVLRSLGKAEEQLGDAKSVAHLREALDLAQLSPERVRISAELGRALTHLGRFDEAIAVLEQGRAEVDELDEVDRELVLEFETLLLNAEQYDPEAQPAYREHRRRLEREVRGDTPAGRLLLADLSFDAVKRAAPAEHAVMLAERAFADGRLLETPAPTAIPIYGALIPVVLADRFDLAERWLEQADAVARSKGWLLGRSQAQVWLARVALATGRVADACEHARRALEHAENTESDFAFPQAAAVLVETSLMDQGPTASLHAIAGRRLSTGTARLPYVAELLLARGRLQLAEGRDHEALSDLLECGARLDAYGLRNPALVQWRAAAAPALVAAGRVEEGRAIADEGVRLARAFGAPSSLSLALRTKAKVSGGRSGLSALEEALSLVEGSDARLAHTEALADLGAALRRSGRRADAREQLRVALDLADSCAAHPLAKRVRGELLATGARPRRAALRGRDALTPSERRVAELAAAGRSNAQIAAHLIVGRRTVETHLSNAYRKLGVHSRRELSDAIGPGGAGRAV
jgi:DNA-binding CsgD family transcriptional regulator